MAKNLANLLTDIVKRAKLNTDDRKTIKAALENSALSSIEVSDEDYDSVFENLHNLETAENVLKPKITNAVKAETLNGFDAQIIEIFGEGLDDSELDPIKNEKITATKLRKAFEAQKKKLETKLGKAQGSGDADLEKALRKEIKELKDSMKSAQESFDQKLKDTEANHKKTLFETKLQTLLTLRTDIADDFKQRRHFAENFKSDLNEFLAKNNIEVDHETEKLLNKETKTPFTTKTHDEVNLDWAIGSVIKDFGYEKKSKVPETVEIDLSKDPKGSPDFLKKSLQKINRED
jgi:hypothetical protein